MKSTRLFLFLFFVVCAFNLSAQSGDQGLPNSTNGQVLAVCINTQIVDGSVRITCENSNRGYTIFKDQTYYYFENQLYVSPGSTITVEAYILGLGYVNTVTLKVPEYGSYSTLYVDVTWVSMHQLFASLG